MRSEIQENLSFTPKETDIYKIHQSGDLANLDGLDNSSLERLPSLLILRDALYSSVFREYLAKITGSGKLSGKKTDMAINVYTPGCHLLCHDDVIGSRRVSYILYLTDPDDPWKEEWGGALRLYPTEVHTKSDGKTVKVPLPDHTVSIPPAFNQLSFFAVQPGESFHDVEEVFESQSFGNKTKDEVDDVKAERNDEIKKVPHDTTNIESKPENKEETTRQDDEARPNTEHGAEDRARDGAKVEDKIPRDEEHDKANDEIDNSETKVKVGDETQGKSNGRIREKTEDKIYDKTDVEAQDKTNDKTHDETNEETYDKTVEKINDETDQKAKPANNDERNDEKTNETKVIDNHGAKKGVICNTEHNANKKSGDGRRVRMAISGWYHIPQEGEDGFVEGLEEKLAEESSLTQLQSKEDDFDLPLTKPAGFNASFDSSFATDNTIQATTTSSREDLTLTEEDLNFLVKYIAPTYLTPDTLESVSNLFTEQCSLTLEAFLSEKFSGSLRDYITIQESQDLPASTSEIESTTPWTVACPPHKHRFLFQQVRGNHIKDPRSQSPLQDLLENLFPSRSFCKWLEIATGETISSQNLLARRFRRGKDYTLATGYNEEDSRLEITMAITPTAGWEPQKIDEKSEDSQGRSSGPHVGDVGDVGGYVAYMAGDEEGDDGREDYKEGDSGDEVQVLSITKTSAKPSGSLGSKSSKTTKADPAIYQAAGNDDDDGVLFSMPAEWNQLGIVLRDKGDMRFVKYISRQAKGDRWDICGEFNVVNQDDAEVLADGTPNTIGNIDDTTEMEEAEEETSDDDWD